MSRTTELSQGKAVSSTETSQFRVAAPADERELSQLTSILGPIFHLSEELTQRYASIVGRENFRIIWRGGELCGGLALVPMGQFFGGRSVPMTGVAVVGIKPEFRGGGTATTLMIEAMRELNAKGTALSALYPATLPLYRRAGYELAGARFEISLFLKQLEIADRGHEIRRMTDQDRPIVERLYRATAQHRTGYLDRNEMMWKRVHSPRGQSTQGFLAINRQSNEAEGYICYMQKDSEQAPYSLVCTDYVAQTPAAGRRLLTLLLDHRTMADVAILHGGATDSILSLLPERTCKVRLLDHWMLRIVDVGAALATRGYPRGLNCEIHLDVCDDVIVSNNGRYVLEIADGEGHISTGGKGDLRIDERGLAALYSGFKTPSELIALGQLSVDSRGRGESLELARSAFASSESSMCDAF